MLGLPKVGAVIAGKYLIEREIGAGGMGTVFAARHELMDKRVALKWLRQEAATSTAKTRFLREARAVARIRHPNVVDVYDVGEHDGALFLVMEYLEGEPLNVFLQRGRVEPKTLLRLLLPAMRGVARAHAEGIVHRDIKPENIFIMWDEEHPEGLAKVLDFGISKLHDDTQDGTVTKTGAVLGTPTYMCKEQLNNTKDLDGRVDVYAFGVVLYQALSGELPYRADSLMSLLMRIATATPAKLSELRPDLPSELCDIVHCAMAREREDRYPSLQDLVRTLSAFALANALISQEEVKSNLVPLPSQAPASRLPGAITPVESAPTISVEAELAQQESAAQVSADARVPQPLAVTSPARPRWPIAAAAMLILLVTAGVLWLPRSAPVKEREQLRAAAQSGVEQPAKPPNALPPELPPVQSAKLEPAASVPDQAPPPSPAKPTRASARAVPRAARSAESATRPSKQAEAPAPAPSAAESKPATPRPKVKLDADNPWE